MCYSTGSQDAQHTCFIQRQRCLTPANLAWKLQTTELPASEANSHTLLPPLLAKQVLRATSLTEERAEINAAAQAHVEQLRYDPNRHSLIWIKGKVKQQTVPR